MPSLSQPVALIEDRGLEVDWTPEPPRVRVFRVQCHYCGYEPPVREGRRTRCPKCGGESWEWYVSPGSLLRTATDDQRGAVTFKLRSPASHAYVQCRRGERSKLVEMTHEEHDIWQVSLKLRPGTYRYRFYMDDGKLLIYWPGQRERSAAVDRTFDVPDPAGTETRGQRRSRPRGRPARSHDNLVGERRP